jgi:hypothetical protein
MSRLRRLTLVLATASLVAQALVVVGPTAVLASTNPPPCVMNGTPCPTFNFGLQTRTFNYQARDGAAKYEWRKTIGTDPFVIYSTAKSPGEISFPCSDIARGLIVTLIERNAAGKQTYIHTFPRIEKCPIEKLVVYPYLLEGPQNLSWLATDPSSDDQLKTDEYWDEYYFGPLSWLDAILNNTGETGNVTLTSNYQGDGIAPTTFDPISGKIGDSSCALFDKHLVVSFVAKGVDGSVVAQGSVAIPPFDPDICIVTTPTPGFTFDPIVDPSESPSVTTSPTASLLPSPTASPDNQSVAAGHAEATRLRIIGAIAFVLAGLIALFGIILPRRRRRR